MCAVNEERILKVEFHGQGVLLDIKGFGRKLRFAIQIPSVTQRTFGNIPLTRHPAPHQSALIFYRPFHRDLPWTPRAFLELPHLIEIAFRNISFLA